MHSIRAVAVLFFPLLWFALGMSVSASPYQNELANEGPSLLRMVELLVVVVMVQGWFNTLGLSVAAAYLGASGRHVMGRKDTEPRFRAAVVRGFLVWLMLFFGKIYFDTAWSFTMDQPQYAKLATTMVLIAFVVGYNPKVFAKLMEEAEHLATGQIPTDPKRSGGAPEAGEE